MSRAKKKLEKWRDDTPVDAPVDEVKSFLERHFPGCYGQKGGSHIVVRDDRLKGRDGFGPDGDFSVPVKNGQRVKGFYLKKIIEAIDILAQLDNSEKDEE